MSVIQQQGIRHSIVNYIGVGISFLSTLFIYNLDVELYGFAQFLVSAANFIIPFMTIGVMGLVLRYYPEFNDPYRRVNFIKSVFVLLLLSSAAFLLLYVLFGEYLLQLLIWLQVDRQNILGTYFNYVVLLAFILSINRLLTIHSSNLRRIVVPEVINNLGYKIILPILVLLGFYQIITLGDVTWSIIIFFVIVGILLAIYVGKQGGFKGRSIKLRDIPREKKREIGSFTFYSAANSLGASMSFRLDMIMLSAMLGFSSNGIYALLLFLSNVIDIPRKSLARIVSPFLSTSLNEGDLEMTGNLYRKASITLLVPSIFIFLLIWSCLPELDKIVSGNPVFYENRYLFLFIAVGRLLDMLFSMNTQIITYSKFYRYNFWFIIVLAVCNMIMNYYFINEYEILGAAMATFFAFVLYNLMKGGLIWGKLGLLPFHKNTFKLILIGAIALIMVGLVPDDLHFILSILLKTIVLFVFYGIPVIYFSISEEINGLLHKGLSYINIK